MFTYKPLLLAITLFALFSTTAVDACTGIWIKSSDGQYFRGRTMEFAAFIPSDIIVIPRGQDYTGTTLSGDAGLQWTTKYAVLGANSFCLPLIVDGLNEEGLSAAAFYFANYVEYQEEPEDKSSVLAPHELCTWILTSFSSVDEVRESVGLIIVPPVELEAFGYTPPIHFIVMDRSGKCIVLEHVNGNLVIHDNPLGIITNSPSFDWHMTNLNNYVNLSVINEDPFYLGGIYIRELGQGGGLLGMPGDFTPPSRFIRAAIYSTSALPASGNDEAVLQTFHILNQFDIPVGSCRRPGTDDDGNIQFEYTLWSSVSDLERCRYYIRTFDNSRIRMVNLMDLDLDYENVLYFSISDKEEIQDLTGNPTILSTE